MGKRVVLWGKEWSCGGKSGPVGGKSGSVGGKSGSVEKKSGLVGGKSGSLEKKSGPVGKKSGPVWGKSGPVGEKSGSVEVIFTRSSFLFPFLFSLHFPPFFPFPLSLFLFAFPREPGSQVPHFFHPCSIRMHCYVISVNMGLF